MTEEGPKIVVEFFGVARLRTGTAQAEFACGDGVSTLGSLRTLITQRFPELARSASPPEGISPEYLVNLDGQAFLSRPDEVVVAGQTVLIMSGDMGG